VKIANRNAAEWISLNSKISLEIVFCRVVQHDSPADRQQDWPMNKD
jgi:hypothetical protein